MEKICSQCKLPKRVPEDFHRRHNGFASERKECKAKRDKKTYDCCREIINGRKRWVDLEGITGNLNPSCKVCGRGIAEVPFGTRMVDGKRYYRHLCKPCHNKDRQSRTSKEKKAYFNALHRSRLSLQRKNLQNVERWVYKDSKQYDKRHGFSDAFDLTQETIKSILQHGCSYCGENSIRMTLDRVDNSKGHSLNNVVSCCIRCNYIRRDIPHEAWLLMVPGVRMARESGKFGQWTGRIR